MLFVWVWVFFRILVNLSDFWCFNVLMKNVYFYLVFWVVYLLMWVRLILVCLKILRMLVSVFGLLWVENISEVLLFLEILVFCFERIKNCVMLLWWFLIWLNRMGSLKIWFVNLLLMVVDLDLVFCVDFVFVCLIEVEFDLRLISCVCGYWVVN